MEEIISKLTPECGHHCGVQMTGRHQLVAHCDCPECHDTRKKEQEDGTLQPNPPELGPEQV